MAEKQSYRASTWLDLCVFLAGMGVGIFLLTGIGNYPVILPLGAVLLVGFGAQASDWLGSGLTLDEDALLLRRVCVTRTFSCQ